MNKKQIQWIPLEGYTDALSCSSELEEMSLQNMLLFYKDELMHENFKAFPHHVLKQFKRLGVIQIVWGGEVHKRLVLSEMGRRILEEKRE